MYRFGMLESYYDHGCSIVHEKDVLLLDIKGNNWIAHIKRWWYDLFLLSYSNRLCRIYHNSSHAMRVERAKHYRRYRDCIHPLSRFRSFWSGMLLHLILANEIIFHHTSSLISAELPLCLYFVAAVFELMVIIDIYINTISGYVERRSKKIILDMQKVRHHYFSTRIFFHAAAAIPVHILMFVRYGLNVNCVKVCKSNKFMCTLVILNIFTLPRFIELTSYWRKERNTFYVTCFFRLLRICMIALVTMLQFISVVDTLTLLSYLENARVESSSYYAAVIYVKYNLVNFSNFKLFTYDLYRTFEALLMFNLGFSKIQVYDKSVSLCSFCLSNIFFFWGLIEVFSFVSRDKYPEDQTLVNKAASIRLAKVRQLPDKICLKLEKFYDFNMTKMTMVEKHSGLYKSLPFILKKEIMVHSYGRLMMKIPYFSEWPIKIIEALVMSLKEEIFLQHDVVAESGVQGDGLYILDVGVLAVYSAENKEMGHLIDGDYFGELSLVTDKEIRTSYVVSVTSSKILILEKSAFRKFMRDFPDLFFEMKQKLRRKYTRTEPKDKTSGVFPVIPQGDK